MALNTSASLIKYPTHVNISPSKIHISPPLINQQASHQILSQNNTVVRTHVAQNLLMGPTSFLSRPPTIINASDVEIKKHIIPGSTTSTITVDTKKMSFSPISNTRGRVNFFATQKLDRSSSSQNRG
jgi:hypothetical protein